MISRRNRFNITNLFRLNRERRNAHSHPEEIVKYRECVAGVSGNPIASATEAIDMLLGFQDCTSQVRIGLARGWML